MFQDRCPYCASVMTLDDLQAEQTVTCPRCRGEFTAQAVSPTATNLAETESLLQREYTRAGRRSVFMGLAGLCFFWCCCISGFLHPLGLLQSLRGLKTQSRGWALVGLVLNLGGFIFCIGFFIFWLVLQGIQLGKGQVRPGDAVPPFPKF